MALVLLMEMKSARIPRNFLLNGSLVAMHFNEGIGMCWSHDALGIDCGSVDAAKIVRGCDTRKGSIAKNAGP